MHLLGQSKPVLCGVEFVEGVFAASERDGLLVILFPCVVASARLTEITLALDSFDAVRVT